MKKFNQSINIGNKKIGPNENVFIIAELSANHNNDIIRAKKIINAASQNGADAIKFQTYTADTITLKSDKPDFIIQGGLWDQRQLYDLYQEGSLPWEWHAELFEYARSLGLIIISTPFDESAVDFLVNLGVDALKIASFELNHTPLIKYSAEKQLPLIISTGMASNNEIKEAVNIVSEINQNLVLLHCISSYPAKPEEYSLSSIQHLTKEFSSIVGLSDHCVDNLAASTSIALGASVIEKHFTIDKSGGGLDDSFSLMPEDLLQLRKNVDLVKKSLKKSIDGCSESEKKSLKFKRSIYASKAIKKGEKFSLQNIKIVRPSHGLHPRYFEKLLGKKSNRNIDFAEPILISDLKNEIL